MSNEKQIELFEVNLFTWHNNTPVNQNLIDDGDEMIWFYNEPMTAGYRLQDVPPVTHTRKDKNLCCLSMRYILHQGVYPDSFIAESIELNGISDTISIPALLKSAFQLKSFDKGLYSQITMICAYEVALYITRTDTGKESFEEFTYLGALNLDATLNFWVR